VLKKQLIVVVEYLRVILCVVETISGGKGIVLIHKQTHLCIIRTNEMPCQHMLQEDLKCDFFVACVSRDVSLLYVTSL
jgi:hypothetical protein